MTHPVQTRILDPIFTSKNRCEFRLDADTLYSTDMRLLNVGISTAPGGRYNDVLGALSVIQSIQLYDNNEMLSQILEASSWNAFSSLRKDNDTNISLSGRLHANSLGFLAVGDYSNTNVGAVNKNSILLTPQQPSKNTVGRLAHISVRDMLPFLAAQAALPTNVFKRLRLVIEFKSSADLANLQSNGTAVNLEPNTRVQLVVDELTGHGSAAAMKMRNEMMMGYKGVAWHEIEHDSVYIPGTGLTTDGTVRQERSFLVSGFNAKSLRRLLMVNTPIDPLTWASGANQHNVGVAGSVVAFDENVQVRCNGQNLFSGSGWSGSNRRLGHLTDTYGPLNTNILCNQMSVPGSGNIASGAFQGDYLGAIDYTGMRVDQRVEELKLSLDRTGVHGSGGDNVKTQTPITLNLYGEVDKGIIMDGTSYSVVYA